MENSLIRIRKNFNPPKCRIYARGAIKSVKETKSDKEKDGVIHQGIAKRSFSKAFTIANDVEIKGAELKDGLLKVSLNKILPEGKKPRKIEVK